MIDILNKLIGSPELLATLLLVAMFLKFIKDREAALAKRDDIFVQSMKQLSDDHIKAREESQRIIAENSVHIINATGAMAQVTEALHGMIVRNKVDAQSTEG